MTSLKACNKFHYDKCTFCFHRKINLVDSLGVKFSLSFGIHFDSTGKSVYILIPQGDYLMKNIVHYHCSVNLDPTRKCICLVTSFTVIGIFRNR
jgi:hypothetical protein